MQLVCARSCGALGLWRGADFKALLRLVKSFILIWDTRKNKLYGDQDSNGVTSIWLLLLLSSDWRSFKLRLRM